MMAKAQLRDTHPELMGELDSSEDSDKVGNYAPTSKHLVNWECEKGHRWEAKVGSRTAGAGCPVCSNRLIIAGVNDLATNHPHLAKEWHPTKNNFEPNSVSQGSGKKVWWKCSQGHEWLTTILSRSSGAGCPDCYGATRAGRRGARTLASCAPKVAAQFVSVVEVVTEHQKTLTGMTVLPNSKVSVKWQEPSCGHSWEQTVEKRFASYQKGLLCGVCDGRFISPGVNDLFTKHPHLLPQWDVNRNGKAAPNSLSAFSNESAFWVCSYGHSFYSPISKRVQGQGCNVCAGKVILVGSNDLASVNPTLAAQWHPSKNGRLKPSQVTANNGNKAWWKCSKGHEWYAVIASRNSGRGCPFCSSRVSQLETEVADYVDSLGLGQVLRSDRTTLAGAKELDIYVPSRKVGIEFNGVYWHSEAAGRGRTYHSDKWSLAQAAGIQLIQIWEDEWNSNPAQVKSMLAHKLGASKEKKVFARKTVVEEVSKDVARKFLEKVHIQGYSSGSYYLGLKEKTSGELVAVLVLKKETNTECEEGLNIIRYATNASVVGGFTKLLKHAQRLYAPDYFITFSDRCVSDGELYRNNGFTADKVLPPDYMYVVDAERKHKFGYRLKRFKNDPALIWEDGKTERELADLNGLVRIWDAGKVRWKKTR